MPKIPAHIMRIEDYLGNVRFDQLLELADQAELDIIPRNLLIRKVVAQTDLCLIQGFYMATIALKSQVLKELVKRIRYEMENKEAWTVRARKR
jgi:hypothetical protein